MNITPGTKHLILRCRLCEQRTRYGVTLSALSKVSGYRSKLIKDWEEGILTPTIKQALRIAEALGIDVNLIWDLIEVFPEASSSLGGYFVMGGPLVPKLADPVLKIPEVSLEVDWMCPICKRVTSGRYEWCDHCGKGHRQIERRGI